MGLLLDARAYLIQKSAPFSARYGEKHRYSGNDLAPPTRLRVPTRHGHVRCEVYRPTQAEPAPAAYVHFHGGAFLMRYPRMDDFFARMVAAETGAVVVTVDYDVAPQNRFPVAHEQCHDVAAWVAAHPAVLDIDPARVAVGGFSAGGNLAASVALQARDLGSFAPVCQLLGVPSLDVAQDPADKTSTTRTAMIGPDLLRLVRGTYFRDVAARASPYASPLRAPSLADLPPAIVITAEHDTLRKEGDDYAARLRDEGVEVLHHVVLGADHYFLEAGPAGARSTLAVILDRLRIHLAAAPGTAGQSR